MTDKVPENSDANRPPETLQTKYTCGHCKAEFETAQALGRHTVRCPENNEDEGE